MHFEFKQAVCLDKKDYSRGVHELPGDVVESLSKNATFLKFKELNLIIECKKPEIISSASILEKNQKLADQFSAPKVEAPSEDQASVKKSKKR